MTDHDGDVPHWQATSETTTTSLGPRIPPNLSRQTLTQLCLPIARILRRSYSFWLLCECWTNLWADSFTHAVLVDRTPMPAHIPPVEEVGATSAPLTSAAFFIGDRCKKYNEDYMLCKHEARGRGELDCMLEGRRVTRCAASVYGPSWNWMFWWKG